jgi:ribokinase
MDVINVGSLNLDFVYRVDHFALPGETQSARQFDVHMGGKGLNQSIALSRAGLKVAHVGAIGSDGEALRNTLKQDNVDITFVRHSEKRSGHAIIQVVSSGQNAIIIEGGANHDLSAEQLEEALNHFRPKALVLQNETNIINDTLLLAKQRGLKIFYNPAPLLPETNHFALEVVDVLIVNEIEAQGLCGNGAPEEQLKLLRERCHPDILCVLTLGAQGVWILQDREPAHFPAFPVERVVDTTAAGDTFIGFFMAGLLRALSVEEAVLQGMRAASICITREGAAASIPHDIVTF